MLHVQGYPDADGGMWIEECEMKGHNLLRPDNPAMMVAGKVWYSDNKRFIR